MNKSALNKINKLLDYKYFGEEQYPLEVTPEYIWEYGILNVGDESDYYEFMVNQIKEYMEALHTTPKYKENLLTKFNTQTLM